jgi:transcriptional regulator with XRE-family HTH domain
VTPLEGFASNVRRLRLERKWSQDALAHRCSVSVSAIARVERAAHTPAFMTIVELARGLGVSPSELWEGVA